MKLNLKQTCKVYFHKVSIEIEAGNVYDIPLWCVSLFDHLQQRESHNPGLQLVVALFYSIL